MLSTEEVRNLKSNIVYTPTDITNRMEGTKATSGIIDLIISQAQASIQIYDYCTGYTCYGIGRGYSIQLLELCFTHLHGIYLLIQTDYTNALLYKLLYV